MSRKLEVSIKISSKLAQNQKLPFRFPIPDSRFPIPDSRFPIPDSRLPLKPLFSNNYKLTHPKNEIDFLTYLGKIN
ncbi:MAG: hypothetical protein F6K55_40920 [Moorea sp. SIO4A3]|nr:hypothetical protein [Moorena sp. SIO4A3]